MKTNTCHKNRHVFKEEGRRGMKIRNKLFMTEFQWLFSINITYIIGQIVTQ
jgi:hypothetical protein